MSEIRVRFAPSPTGFLHIGGARTAIFNYLYARKNNGKFILRIEDTDTERSTKEFEETILNSMKWLGMDWDEGPFYQTKRFDIYEKYLDMVIANGTAYKCWCKPEELSEYKKIIKADKRKLKKKGIVEANPQWLSERDGISPVVILETPEDKILFFNDLIKGKIEFNSNDLDDFIIWRSNNTPIYNFVVVIDDYDLKISHVIRGDDHISNTPKQILIYQALGFKEPEFAHVPMILGPDGKRLSKRHGATSVEVYKEEGYLPEALFNYLVRLGWSHGDQEVFSKEELIEFFDISNVGKSAATFNPKKLLWLNAEYINKAKQIDLLNDIKEYLPEGKYESLIKDKDFFEILGMVKLRSKTLLELKDSIKFYYELYPKQYEEKSVKKFWTKPGVVKGMELLLDDFSGMIHFSKENIENSFAKICEQENLKLKDIAQGVRLAIVGKTVSPGLFEIIEIIGKVKTMRKITRALEYIKENSII